MLAMLTLAVLSTGELTLPRRHGAVFTADSVMVVVASSALLVTITRGKRKERRRPLRFLLPTQADIEATRPAGDSSMMQTGACPVTHSHTSTLEASALRDGVLSSPLGVSESGIITREHQMFVHETIYLCFSEGPERTEDIEKAKVRASVMSHLVSNLIGFEFKLLQMRCTFVDF